MTELDLHGEVFRDKLLGCWLGKNAGGTLGAPLEEGWGRREPFDISWYPELPEGGIPNDDLEMQLVWLAALKQVGPGLRAQDLARYWLDHIGYNWDEYGLSKTNLRLGLQPPMSGSYNNWFVDCMGCPIRSEIWACVAPGLPRVAARYAYEDAICDHAGGESVYGELFNVATQSAGFVVTDPQRLLDIGLSYVPEDSATALAVRTARQAHADGVDWKEARLRVLDAVPSTVAQFSPINIGFQVLGLLYGSDFGDALCITVNSGYDTDSSGASIGSLLGILAGRSGLPDRWLEPFGSEIATNEHWDGVRHMSDGTAPIPGTLPELLDEIITQATVVLTEHGYDISGGVLEVDDDDLMADESIRDLWSRSSTTIDFDYPQVGVSIDYHDDPVVVPGTARSVTLTVRNPHPDAVVAHVSWLTPVGWVPPQETVLEVPAHGHGTVEASIGVPDDVDIAPVAYAAVRLEGYPVPPATPITFVGARVWQVCESTAGSDVPPGDNELWRTVHARTNALPLAEVVQGPGTYWMRTFLDVPADMSVLLGVDTTGPARSWLDDVPLQQVTERKPLRPNYNGAHPTANLTTGWHTYVVGIDVGHEDLDPQAHLLISTADDLRHGITTIGHTRLPAHLREVRAEVPAL